MTDDVLVSVIIPAHNAEATLAGTLDSVCRQTYKNLEVIVVDDGSVDATAAIARNAAERDSRIRVVSVPNGGVAKARNIGIKASRGALIAPIDADDLWHPDKTARQLAVMRAGGTGMGFVYSPLRRIDEQDRVLVSSTRWTIDGHAFLRSVLLNFVGSGSSILIRREALETCGGYEPDLQAQGAHGCEDFLLQALIAREWKVGVAPEYLVGYRRTKGAMSEDFERMQRSHLLALDHIRRRVPETPAGLIETAEAAELARLAVYRLMQKRSPKLALRAFVHAWRRDASAASMIARNGIRHSLKVSVAEQLRRFGSFLKTQPQHDFYNVEPVQHPRRAHRHPLQDVIDALAGEETSFIPARLAAETGSMRSEGRAERRMHWSKPGRRPSGTAAVALVTESR